MDFDISIVEPLGSVVRELVMNDIKFKNLLQVEIYFMV
jgi:hypothetical protein